MDAIRLFISGLTSGWSNPVEWYAVISLLAIAALMVLSYYITEGVLWGVGKIVAYTETTWDDDLLNARFMRALSQLSPALVLNWLLPEFFFRETEPLHWIKLVTSLYILVTIVYIICIFVGNLYDAMASRENTRLFAVKGVFDMLRLIVIAAGVIVAVSMVWGRSLTAIFTALGASAAVLMLVFKDTILGLVAGVQLTVNRMLHAGDWIVADKHGINGEVEEVSLTTIKVRNWDNSVSTVPPYALVTESFKNYQPMRNSGARRVERSIYLDFDSVRFLEEEEMARLREKGLLKGIEPKKGERPANISLMRRYVELWLSRHPRVLTDSLYMVREMAPTQSGLPLNIYFFTDATAWKEFEKVQSDIFDHLYAIIREFHLRIFQSPTRLIEIEKR